jgi:hypothetical protein
MTFQAGDRVRWNTTADDGLPLVRYGFVGGCNGDGNRVVVMPDGDLTGDIVVDHTLLEPVSVTTIELRLDGADLLDDPSLRPGLVNLWAGEADAAGLEIRAIECVDAGDHDQRGVVLAELWAGAEQYVLHARPDRGADVVHIAARRF